MTVAELTEWLKTQDQTHGQPITKLLRYTPDFVVQMADGMIEVHEVKGHWEDDALVKIKVAAEMFPFRFLAVQKIAQKAGGGWTIREF